MSAPALHRLQRSPFGWLALSTLASCTLTSGDFEPQRLPDPASVEEAADALEPLTPATAPSGETDVPARPEVPATNEAPPAPDLPLAPSEPPSEPTSAPVDTEDDAPAPCTLDCCPEPGCSTEPPSEDEPVTPAASCSDAVQNAGETGTDCGGPACAPCPCTYGAPEVLGDPNYAGNLLSSPSLSPDGLTLCFGLYILGFPTETIAFSTRPSPAEPFGLGNPLPAPINASIEGTPRLSADSLTLYFYSERAGGLGGRDIFRAQRTAPDTAFDVVTNLTEINSAAMDHLPWVSPDGLSMYFSSDRAGDLDIHRATRASTTDPWQAPERVAELNTAAVENGMTLSADAREIVFASTRLGSSDFFRAVRAPGETTFGAPELLASINSDAEDADPALSPDGTELYFSSTRDGTDSRIWRVSRTCP